MTQRAKLEAGDTRHRKGASIGKTRQRVPRGPVRSHQAVLTATAREGKLLGGKHEVRSSRFGDKADAAKWLDVTLNTNLQAGNGCMGKVVPCNQPPEVFRHCGTADAQIVGGKCSGCGRVLTEDDAKAHVATG